MDHVWTEEKKDALEEAEELANDWRRLALQFDGHRMSALWFLKALVRSPGDAELTERADEFLKQPPLSGEQELANRLASMLEVNGQSTQGQNTAIDGENTR